MNAVFDRLPLVVGVTGHRDLPAGAETTLRQHFNEVLDRLQQQHPAMPLLLLSGVAAGADLLAAEEALRRGVAVFACLPRPQTEYERDFTAEELERFRRVLPLCRNVVVVGTRGNREQGYVDVADFIAYYCHVLVAFWDGLPARGRGGTAEVVELRQGALPGLVGDALVAYVPDVGPVFHIVTSRKDQPVPEHCFSVQYIYPDRLGWKTKADKADRTGEQEFEQAIDHLEQLNRDLAREPAPAELDPLAALRDRANAAANRLQWRTVRSLQGVYLATAAAGAAQLVLPTDGAFRIPSWAGIAARIGFLAIAVVVLAIAKRNDFENRYQDYRAIAEALRVQYAWCCAGLCNRLVEASYLQMQQSELAWIRLALRTAYLVSGAGTGWGAGSPESAESVRWIDGQLEYYEGSGKREEKHLRRAHTATLVVVVTGAVLSAAATIVAWLLSHGKLPVSAAQYHLTAPVLAYWATMPFALAGMVALLIRFYLQQRGFAENARRYQHMFTVFDAARRRLRDQGRDPRKALEQLGHEALSEHADWLILHRDRPLTFVHT